MTRMWTLGAAVACLICLQWLPATATLPTDEGMAIEDVRQPVYRGNHRTRERKSDIPEATATTTGATPISESLRSVTKQLLQPTDVAATAAADVRTKQLHSANEMVSDVRTPPRVRTKVGEAKIEKVEGSSGVGEAVAVVDTVLVTQAPGLSTWILLNNVDSTKGRPSTQATVLAVEKPSAKLDGTSKLQKPAAAKTPPKKANASEDVTKSPIILQDSKFRNRTPVVVGRVPTTPIENQTKPTIATAAQKGSPSPTQPTKFLEIVPTTSLILESDTIGSTDEASTTENSNTTKRTRRPGTKTKKKKNKNRRRRPTKPEDTAESKITPDLNSLENTKIVGHPNRPNPLSSRIYDYLAREVMPSVGVGIVGLVLTAGLAGFFLYPFGGAIARRNYDKGSPPPNNYYYSDYIPRPDDQGALAEDKIYTPSSSLNQKTYSSSSYDSKYNTNKYNNRYDHDYGQTINGYAGNSEYSTLPDSVKNSDFSLSDSSKYYSMDPVSSQYKLTDVDKYKDEANYPSSDKYKEENNYPSLTEYTAYTNAASVGTRGSFENVDISQNDTLEEDKSDKSQPEFSALVGSPQFTNTDFVGSVSLTGGYGTDVQRTGALASEHGPRALRKARDVHDDFVNEIDVSDDKIYRRPLTTAATPKATDPPTIETTTSYMTTTTEEQLTTDINHSPPQTTTEFSFMDIFTEGSTKDNDAISDSSPSEGTSGFIGFIKRLAQLKLKIGINLLKSTSEAVQRYFDNVAKRMEEAVRHLQKRRRSLLLSASRIKRDTSKPYKKKYRKHKKHQ